MNYEDYLIKINSVENKQEREDLENIITQINRSSSKIEFHIGDLFHDSNTSDINSELLLKIEKTLNLILVEEEKTNVCFANNEEVRPEYKESFKLEDLLDYMYAFVYSSFYKRSKLVIIGSETILFWELAGMGKTYQ